MNLDHLSATLSPLGPNLKDHVLQSTVFAAGAVLIALGMRKNFARTRYWVWLAASIKFLIPFSMLMTVSAKFMPHRPPAPTVATVYNIIDVVGQPFSAASAATMSHAASVHYGRFSWPLFFPLFIALIWALGTLSILTTWGIYWWRIRGAVRRATKAITGPEISALRKLQETGWGTEGIQLCLSETNVGPGVYGIIHSTLIWPSRISQRLNDAQIKSIIAHELCHAERRDNLTACFHMVVEAIFWFHPLVWWLGSRLELERERACDEHVLHLTKAPQTYAESILKVCEICLESPLECVSGVTGANLKERISRIMMGQVGERLTLSRKVFLIAAILISLSVPLLFGQATTDRGVQTSFPSDGVKQRIEVATIKPSSEKNRPGKRFSYQGRRLQLENMTIRDLLVFAYGINSRQALGGPPWIDEKKFDIVAQADGASAPSPSEWKLMLLQLLQSRFDLQLHQETRKMRAYVLTTSPGGNKLVKSFEPQKDPSKLFFRQLGDLNAENVSIQTFAHFMQDIVLPLPVVDRTDLKGRWNFRLLWTPDETQFFGIGIHPQTGQAGPGDSSLSAAVRNQLGLRLEVIKTSVPVYIVDNVSQPSPN